MLISQTTEYALRAAVILARESGQWLTNQQIAEASGVPAGYLAKILRLLARADLVASQRGVGGGFTLARHASEISLLDVFDAVDPIVRIRRCPLNLPQHRDRLCPLHQTLDDAIAGVQETFAAKSLEELVHQAAQPGLCLRTRGPSACNGDCKHQTPLEPSVLAAADAGQPAPAQDDHTS